MGVISPQVHGAALIRVDVGQGLVDFGYTVNGARETEEGMAAPIYGDQNGGEQGQPIDFQDLGSIGHVRLEMATWDAEVEMNLRKRVKGGTAGVPGTPGTLIFANNKHFRLVVRNATTGRNWPCALLLRTPIEINKGVLHSRLLIDFECYKNPSAANGALAGVLYNDYLT